MDDMVPDPQVKAASVNSCTTAETWMAEISAALAQDETRASAKDMLATVRAAAQAPNLIHCIQTSSLVPPRELSRIATDPPSLWKAGTFLLILAFMNREQVLHVLSDMRRFGTLALAFAALAAGSGPAWAFRGLDPNPIPLTEHQRELRYIDSQTPLYARSYSDEAARTLGVENGKWEAFSTRSRDPLMPSFRGGIDQGRAMIGLQWRR